MDKRITRAKAIRLKCLDCCAGFAPAVRWCELKHCPLWRYRMGKEERDHLYYEGKTERENSDSEEMSAED